MTDIPESQVVFDRYLQGHLSLDEAVDALFRLMRDSRAIGGVLSGLRKPEGAALSTVDVARTDALFAAIDRRLAQG